METPSQGLKKRGAYDKDKYARKKAKRTPAEHEAFKAERREYMKRWRAENGDRHRGYGITFRKRLIAAMNPEELAAFRLAEREKTKRLNTILKDDVFTAYGGWKCACCGEVERDFLTIDHMQNNGSKLRREGVHGHGMQFYRWLKKSGFPPEFQVLCMNCQFGKRMSKDHICPHQARCNDYSARK